MKELYLIRHGETEMNVAGLASGHTDTPLTATGLNQAKEAGLSIKERNIILDRIFSSPLQRAHHTAKGIVKHLDYDEDSIELLELIKERNFGEIEGKSLSKDFGIDTDLYFENETLIDDTNGIEKLEEAHKRAVEAIDFLKAQPEHTILIVTHSNFGRCLYRAANDLPYNAKVPKINNAEIIKLI